MLPHGYSCSMTYFLYGTLAFALWLNCAATYHLVRSHAYDRQQKTWQIVIIWLVPVFGALLILSVMSGRQPRKPANDAQTGILGTVFATVFLSGLLAPGGQGAESGETSSIDVGGFDGGGQ